MKTPKFIKLTAHNGTSLVAVTLNTRNIDSYSVNTDSCNFGTKCRISTSSQEMGCDIFYVMETKDYLDNLLT